jgi:ribosome-binding factor A
MPSHRRESVGKAVQNELSEILRTEVKDPRLGFVTITGVQMTQDLKLARVYISVMGDEEARTATLEGLDRAQSYIRRLIGGRLQLRNVPELMFSYDDSMERGSRIDALLDDLKP